MNTEFPSRVPTITRTRQSNNSTSLNTENNNSNSTSQLKKQIEDVVKESIKNLKSFSDKVTNLINPKNLKRKDQKTKKDTNNTKETKTDPKTYNVLVESMNTLKRLAQLVSDFFGSFGIQPTFGAGNTTPNLSVDFDNSDKNKDREEVKNTVDKNKKSENNREESEEKENRARFRKWVILGITKVAQSWAKGITNLQGTIETTTASLGQGVGRVFGSGIFGNMIGKVITKALSFAVSKVLVGIVLSNLPIIAIIGAVIFAIYLVIKYAQEIWDAIKWVGWAIDQGIDAIIALFGKSKYKEAREQMAKKLGVTEKALLDYYGDTVRGRNQMYEDFQKMMSNPAFMDEMSNKLKEAIGWYGKASSTPEVVKGESTAQQIIHEINYLTNNTNYYYNEEKPQSDILGLNLSGNQPLMMTPITSNQTTNTSVNMSPSTNVESSSPYSSTLPNANSDILMRS